MLNIFIKMIKSLKKVTKSPEEIVCNSCGFTVKTRYIEWFIWYCMKYFFNVFNNYTLVKKLISKFYINYVCWNSFLSNVFPLTNWALSERWSKLQFAFYLLLILFKQIK